MERRRFLQIAGGTGAAAMTGLAGCSSLSGGGGGGVPNGERASYDSWVGTGGTQGDQVNAFTLDLEVYRTLQNQDEETQTETETSANTETDPLSGIPASYLFAAALGLGFGLSGTGLSATISADGSAQRAHFADNGIILEGSFDAEALGSSVTSSGGEEAESYEGYTLYRRGSGSDSTVIGLSGDAAVVVSASDDVSDPMARTKTLIDVGTGSATRLSDESDDFDSLVTALPSQGLSGVTYRPDGGLFEGSGSGGQDGGGSSSGLSGFSDLDLSGNAVGGATSAAISMEQLEANLAIRYESESEVDAKADIEAALGGQASSSSVTIDGRMVYAEGTYEDMGNGN